MGGGVITSAVVGAGSKLLSMWGASKKSAQKVREHTAEKLTGREGWVVAMVFGVWAGPVLVTMISPAQGHEIAGAIAAMPSDYYQTFQQLTYVAIGAPVLLRVMK